MDVQTLLESLIRNVIWLKFFGVFLIVYGVILCVTIIGAVFGWLPLWLGVLLYSSADRLDAVEETANVEDAVESIEKISRFFKISGIVSLVYAVILVSLLVIFFGRWFVSFMGLG
ncbi:MAG: DUF5362 family protein [Gammaproteobacteria bacterium]|nr:DUF5362 family protein [Gammaproteobacteria bacterium]